MLVSDQIFDDFGAVLDEDPSYFSCALLVSHLFPNWLQSFWLRHYLIAGAVRTSSTSSVRRRQRWSTILVSTSHTAPRSAMLSSTPTSRWKPETSGVLILVLATPHRGLLLVLCTTWNGRFELVVISMGGARKCSTLQQLLHVTCILHNFCILFKS